MVLLIFSFSAMVLKFDARESFMQVSEKRLKHQLISRIQSSGIIDKKRRQSIIEIQF